MGFIIAGFLLLCKTEELEAVEDLVEVSTAELMRPQKSRTALEAQESVHGLMRQKLTLRQTAGETCGRRRITSGQVVR